MTVPRPFPPVKLVCGILAADHAPIAEAERRLVDAFGPIESRGPRVPFIGTEYYRPEMGSELRRGFIAFRDLIDPETLPEVKILTNAMEESIRVALAAAGRVVNLDPGILTAAALIMATAKDFSHRIPLRSGIYAHLELLWTKSGARRLEWTYPDLRTDDHIPFLMEVRRAYLESRKDDAGDGHRPGSAGRRAAIRRM